MKNKESEFRITWASGTEWRGFISDRMPQISQARIASFVEKKTGRHITLSPPFLIEEIFLDKPKDEHEDSIM